MFSGARPMEDLDCEVESMRDSLRHSRVQLKRFPLQVLQEVNTLTSGSANPGPPPPSQSYCWRDLRTYCLGPLALSICHSYSAESANVERSCVVDTRFWSTLHESFKN